MEQRKYRKYNVLAFVLLAIILFSYMIQPTASKYVFTQTGRAMASLISGNVFTDTFVLKNNSFVDADGNIKETATSNNLHGMFQGDGAIDLNDLNATYEIPNNKLYEDYDLNSLTNKIFVVQNNSDRILIACFDIIVCMGWSGSGDPTLNCTITEQESGEQFSITAKKNGTPPSNAPLKVHKESTNDSTGEFPVINVKYSGILGDNWSPYRAYSTQIDVHQFSGAVSNDVLEAFTIGKGEVKTFTLSVSASGADIGSLDRNAYASMSMTVKIVE